MRKFEKSYLTGKCLVAAPHAADERFAQTLVYICSHNQNGAMGFVVNKRIKDFSFADLTSQLSARQVHPLELIDVHNGGPLEKIRGFVLHSTDYVKDDTVIIDDNMAVSSSIDIITDIAFGLGPKYNLVALGYASWGPHQLEDEIIDNQWLVTTPTTDLVFKTKDEEKWQKAIDDLGIDVSRLADYSGHS